MYLKRGWSLRRISNELGCSKTTVRKKLIEAGVDIEEKKNQYQLLNSKIKSMRAKGQSYQTIADTFNLWEVKTRSGEGVWHAKTVRELELL